MMALRAISSCHSRQNYNSDETRYITQVGLVRLDINEESLALLARSPQIPDEFVVYHHILVEGWRRSKQSLFSPPEQLSKHPALGQRSILLQNWTVQLPVLCDKRWRRVPLVERWSRLDQRLGFQSIQVRHQPHLAANPLVLPVLGGPVMRVSRWLGAKAVAFCRITRGTCEEILYVQKSVTEGRGLLAEFHETMDCYW